MTEPRREGPRTAGGPVPPEEGARFPPEGLTPATRRAWLRDDEPAATWMEQWWGVAVIAVAVAFVALTVLSLFLLR